MGTVEPVSALRQIAFHLERSGEPTHKVQAFRRAAATIAGLGEGELDAQMTGPAPSRHSLASASPRPPSSRRPHAVTRPVT